jgi:predicted NBD/HSP70 family sugar kinase
MKSIKPKAKSCTLGFDIGASSVKAVLAHDGKIIKKISDNTPQDFIGLLELMSDLRWELLSGMSGVKLEAVGVAVAGVLDKKREKMLVSPNMRFLNGKNLQAAFLKYLSVSKLKIEHDAHALLVAEIASGATRGKKNVFCLAVGSGIGSAFTVDGKMIYGAHGAAGEAGHMIVRSQTEHPLEFEELAANKFIYQNLGVNFREAFRRAKAGDKKAAVVFAALGENLGVGVANIINIFDPELIIVGGGIAEAHMFFEKGMQHSIKKYVTSPLTKKTAIVWSRTGEFGGALGATLLFSAKK